MAEPISSRTEYEGRAQSFAAARKQTKALYRFLPHYRNIHPLSADAPEETYFAEVATRCFMASAPPPGHRQWIDQADPIPWHVYLKKVRVRISPVRDERR